jgi:hypothetical protein
LAILKIIIFKDVLMLEQIMITVLANATYDLLKLGISSGKDILMQIINGDMDKELQRVEDYAKHKTEINTFLEDNEANLISEINNIISNNNINSYSEIKKSFDDVIKKLCEQDSKIQNIIAKSNTGNINNIGNMTNSSINNYGNSYDCSNKTIIQNTKNKSDIRCIVNLLININVDYDNNVNMRDFTPDIVAKINQNKLSGIWHKILCDDYSVYESLISDVLDGYDGSGISRKDQFLRNLNYYYHDVLAELRINPNDIDSIGCNSTIILDGIKTALLNILKINNDTIHTYDERMLSLIIMYAFVDCKVLAEPKNN